MIEVVRYQNEQGFQPFTQWLDQLKNKQAKAQIIKRLTYMELGNFGDSSSVMEGVNELRVHVGAGYRVYYARHGQVVVVLLCGGDKSSQARDIQLARQYWAKWKKGQKS